jgi:hypothetical protein
MMDNALFAIQDLQSLDNLIQTRLTTVWQIEDAFQ